MGNWGHNPTEKGVNVYWIYNWKVWLPRLQKGDSFEQMWQFVSISMVHQQFFSVGVHTKVSEIVIVYNVCKFEYFKT